MPPARRQLSTVAHLARRGRESPNRSGARRAAADGRIVARADNAVRLLT